MAGKLSERAVEDVLVVAVIPRTVHVIESEREACGNVIGNASVNVKMI